MALKEIRGAGTTLKKISTGKNPKQERKVIF